MWISSQCSPSEFGEWNAFIIFTSLLKLCYLPQGFRLLQSFISYLGRCEAEQKAVSFSLYWMFPMREVHKIKGPTLYKLLKGIILLSTFWGNENALSKFKTTIKYCIICFCLFKGNYGNLSEINFTIFSSLLHDCSWLIWTHGILAFSAVLCIWLCCKVSTSLLLKMSM